MPNPRPTAPPLEPPPGVLGIAWQAGVDLWHRHTPAPDDLEQQHCRPCATAWPCLTSRFLSTFLRELVPYQPPDISDRRAILTSGRPPSPFPRP